MDIEEARARLAGVQVDGAGALARIALIVERYAKKRTPVLTGTLRRSITHRVEASGERAQVGTNVEYSSFVHEGTVKMVGRPYLQQGKDDAANEIQGVLDDLGESTLESIVG